MVQIIPLEESKTKRCHYCETWFDVRYRVSTEELDRVYYGATGHVCCCGKCAKRHYKGNECLLEDLIKNKNRF